MMDIVLAYLSGQSDRSDPYISLLPVGLCSLQACLRRDGHNAKLANFSGWSHQEMTRYLLAAKPAMLGISIWTHNRHTSLELARLVRKLLPGCHLVAGGAHASFQYADLLLSHDTPFDVVVIGEGEATLGALAQRVARGQEWHDLDGIAFSRNGEVVVTSPRSFLQELDQLPFPASCLEYSVGVDQQLQPEFILSSRGCPSACTFCSSPAFWSRKVRFRSPISMVDEIVFIRDRYGLIYFSIRDDTFTVDRSRTIEFCRLLIEARLGILWNCQSRVNVLDHELLVWMKRAGCECIQLGVESGSPRILKQLGKAITPQQVEHAAGLIRAVGINLSIYLISDIPGETEQDQQLTLELIRRVRPDDGYVSPLAYFPGTRLFESARESGVVSSLLFSEQQGDALFVAASPARNQRLLKTLARSGVKKNASLFRQQKELLGYCYASNVIAGEWYRQNGDISAAEKEFKEICERDPDNPWGAFLLAELLAETGRSKAAQAYYATVCTLVSRHQPSLDVLKS